MWKTRVHFFFLSNMPYNPATHNHFSKCLWTRTGFWTILFKHFVENAVVKLTPAYGSESINCLPRLWAGESLDERPTMILGQTWGSASAGNESSEYSLPVNCWGSMLAITCCWSAVDYSVRSHLLWVVFWICIFSGIGNEGVCNVLLQHETGWVASFWQPASDGIKMFVFASSTQQVP